MGVNEDPARREAVPASRTRMGRVILFSLCVSVIAIPRSFNVQPCDWRGGPPDGIQLSVNDPGFAVLVRNDNDAGHRLPECSGHILADASLAGAIVRIRVGMRPRGQEIRTGPAVAAIDLDVQQVAPFIAAESYDRVENT